MPATADQNSCDLNGKAHFQVHDAGSQERAMRTCIPVELTELVVFGLNEVEETEGGEAMIVFHLGYEMGLLVQNKEGRDACPRFPASHLSQSGFLQQGHNRFLRVPRISVL